MARALLLFVFAYMAGSTAMAAGCRFLNLPINPVTGNNGEVFQGESEAVKVRFDNFKTEGSVEVFPDSKLSITDKRGNATCAIDGGVWARKDIYVSVDNAVLLAHEFSGSNDFLNFYAIDSCKKLGEIDISNSSWSFDRGNISVFRQAGKNKSAGLKTYALSKYCFPDK
jgi:hypothetical protein